MSLTSLQLRIIPATALRTLVIRIGPDGRSAYQSYLAALAPGETPLTEQEWSAPNSTTGGATTFSALTDKATADLPGINLPLATILLGKLSVSAAAAAYQPLGSYAPATGIAPSAITGTAVTTSDPRLSDARAPTAHHHDGSYQPLSEILTATTAAATPDTLVKRDADASSRFGFGLGEGNFRQGKAGNSRCQKRASGQFHSFSPIGPPRAFSSTEEHPYAPGSCCCTRAVVMGVPSGRHRTSILPRTARAFAANRPSPGPATSIRPKILRLPKYGSQCLKNAQPPAPRRRIYAALARILTALMTKAPQSTRAVQT